MLTPRRRGKDLDPNNNNRSQTRKRLPNIIPLPLASPAPPEHLPLGCYKSLFWTKGRGSSSNPIVLPMVSSSLHIPSQEEEVLRQAEMAVEG